MATKNTAIIEGTTIAIVSARWDGCSYRAWAEYTEGAMRGTVVPGSKCYPCGTDRAARVAAFNLIRKFVSIPDHVNTPGIAFAIA
jgi:hypothetical protein